MFFSTSTDKILSSFQVTINKLIKHSDELHAKASDHLAKSDFHKTSASIAMKESSRAALVADKLSTIIN